MTTVSANLTIGMDLGNKKHEFCVLGPATPGVKDAPREVGALQNTRAALEAFAERFAGARVLLEASTQSAFISTVLDAGGLDVTVANPRELSLIYGSNRKSDRVDAEALARLARADIGLIKEVHHLDQQAYADLAVIRSRAALVETRTKLISSVRSLCKGQGVKLKTCATAAFARLAISQIPRALAPAIHPVLSAIEHISRQIRELDRRIETLADEHYPQTKLLRTVPGVGPIIALTYVLRLEDPMRFRKSRDVGAFLGLVPKRDQSGDVDRQLHISKCGDPYLRKLLVQSAHYILGPFGPDSHLRRHGEKIASRGGRAAKRRASVAVARKLAVLLHRLWADGTAYEPFYTPPGHRMPASA
jgi:transposase